MPKFTLTSHLLGIGVVVLLHREFLLSFLMWLFNVANSFRIKQTTTSEYIMKAKRLQMLIVVLYCRLYSGCSHLSIVQREWIIAAWIISEQLPIAICIKIICKEQVFLSLCSYPSIWMGSLSLRLIEFRHRFSALIEFVRYHISLFIQWMTHITDNNYCIDHAARYK